MPITEHKKAERKTIWCPRCHQTLVEFIPAPDQRENEDSLGPRSVLPDWWHGAQARISPPDDEGKTYLLVPRKEGDSPSYWPAENRCLRCNEVNRRAAAAWNAFMGRAP